MLRCLFPCAFFFYNADLIYKPSVSGRVLTRGYMEFIRTGLCLPMSGRGLTRENIEFNSTGLQLRLRWTKKLQLGPIPGSPLCPVQAFKAMFQA